MVKAHIIMQILSDNDYKILNSFQTEMQTSCNF